MMSDKSNLKIKKKKKKNSRVSTGLILLMLILIIIILGIVLIIINRIQQNNEKKISLKLSSVEWEAGSGEFTLHASDVLEGDSSKISNAVIDSSHVNADKPGIYNAEIQCDGTTYIIKVNVRDTAAPVLKLHKDDYRSTTGTVIYASSMISSVEDVTEIKAGFVESSGMSDIQNNIKESVTYNDTGVYNIYVVVIDEGGNTSSAPVTITIEDVVHAEYLNSGADILIDLNTDYSAFSTDTVPYGYGTEVDSNNRPGGCTWYDNKWGQFAVDFIQPMSNYVFLTFDEGYEYGNTPEILDILKEKDAKAVFFVTLPFAQSQPELIKRMIDEGHVIGNHTATHPNDGLCTLSVSEQIDEIMKVHDYMIANYNYEMYLFRFPTGAFSDQSLAIVQGLGYRSVFWSFAHKDWDVNNQPDVQESLEKALNTAHGGEIFLLHGVSVTDTRMLPDLIDGLREKGFEIGYYAKTN